MAQISSRYFVLLTWRVHRTKTLNSAWKTFAKNTNSRELLRCLSAVSTQSILTGLISFELFFLRRERGSSEMNSIFTSNSLHGHYNAPCVCVRARARSRAHENKLHNGAVSLIIVSLAAFLRSLYHVAYVFTSLFPYLTPLAHFKGSFFILY